MAESLYGIKQASKTKQKDISSSTSLSFSSNLSALISNSSKSKSQPNSSLLTPTSASTTTTGRPRPSKSKPDIFTSHNKNVKKRSAADLEAENDSHTHQKHRTKEDIGSISTSELHRSKRKMEEKARLYNAMKRGEYIGVSGHHGTSGAAENGLVDFDRKWAEYHTHGQHNHSDSGHSSDPDSDSSSSSTRSTSAKEQTTYIDEFGRLRTGTKSQARRMSRKLALQTAAQTDLDSMRAHPSQPSNIIYGDTIQSSAFNPDTVIADRMASIAAKRDRSATPPPETHFDASAEIRNRGTGFYAFSQDAEERRREMEELEKQRVETERVRMEREEVKEKRKREVEERRKLLAEKRAKGLADRFLSGLDVDLVGDGAGKDDREENKVGKG